MNNAPQSAANKLALLRGFQKDPAANDLAEGGLLLTWMDSLNDYDLADCVLRATVQGNEMLVRTLMERRGPVPIHFEYKIEASHSYWLNGNPISKPDRCYDVAHEPAELKSLLSMVREFDMKGLLDPGHSYPLMLADIDRNQDLRHFNTSIFCGELPVLDSGVLHVPDLAIELANEIQCAATPDAYRPMLCWATPDMVTEFAQYLAPLHSFQEVVGHGSMAQWKASVGDPNCMEFTSMSLGLRPSENTSSVAIFLVNTMGPEAAVMGFDDLQGRVLCETTVDFILQFPAGECSPENSLEAVKFVRNYCPMDIIATQAAEVCVSDYGHVSPEYKFQSRLDLHTDKGFNELFFMLGKGASLRERALDMMTREQWLGIIQKSKGHNLHPESLLAIRDTFGVDNTGMQIKLDDRVLKILLDGGYRFVDATRFFNQIKPYGEFIKNPATLDATTVFSTLPELALYQKTSFLTDPQRVDRMVFMSQQLLATNLWPVMGEERPACTVDAMRDSLDVDFKDWESKKAMALYAFLVNVGVDACAESAKSLAHWMKLTEIFSADELNPYLKLMPSQARGRVLESGLGL
jgi:hypothetical protein